MKSEKAIEIITSVDYGDDIELVQAIETVLQDLQKYKDITTKQDKKIELMSLALAGIDFDKCCDYCNTDICTANEDIRERAKCVKQYFEKLANEESE